MSFSFPARVYPIVDTLNDPRLSHVELAKAILFAGAPLLQLRVKNAPTGRFVELAGQVKALADRYGARLVINDRPDIAKLIDAAGVHLGQDDVPVGAARRMLGADKIIGLSTHTLAQAETAARHGVVDYIGCGPIFPTHSKEHPDPVLGIDGLRVVRARIALPIVAIGGISAATMGQVLEAGADAVAMISEIVRAPDVAATVGALLTAAARAGRGSPDR